METMDALKIVDPPSASVDERFCTLNTAPFSLTLECY